MLQPLLDYYRIAEEAVRSVRFATQTATGDVGFFRFGSQIICYGRCSSGVASDCEGSAKFNVGNGVHGAGPVIQLPFDPAEVIENLRLERYQQQRSGGLQRFASSEPARKSYYFFRRCLPFPIRRQLQRIYFSRLGHDLIPSLARGFYCGCPSRKVLAAIDGGQWREEGAVHLVLARGSTQLPNHDTRRGDICRP